MIDHGISRSSPRCLFHFPIHFSSQTLVSGVAESASSEDFSSSASHSIPLPSF